MLVRFVLSGIAPGFWVCCGAINPKAQAQLICSAIERFGDAGAPKIASGAALVYVTEASAATVIVRQQPRAVAVQRPVAVHRPVVVQRPVVVPRQTFQRPNVQRSFVQQQPRNFVPPNAVQRVPNNVRPINPNPNVNPNFNRNLGLTPNRGNVQQFGNPQFNNPQFNNQQRIIQPGPGGMPQNAAVGGPVNFTISSGSAKVVVSPSSGSLGAAGTWQTITVTARSLIAVSTHLVVKPGNIAVTVVLTIKV